MPRQNPDRGQFSSSAASACPSPAADPIAVAAQKRMVATFTAQGAKVLRIVKLASELGVSPVALVRCFKRTFGLPPYQYYLRLRCQRALHLLRQGPTDEHPTIADVGRACGYVDVAHMRKAFRAAFSLTPMGYAKHVGAHPAWTSNYRRHPR